MGIIEAKDQEPHKLPRKRELATPNPKSNKPKPKQGDVEIEQSQIGFDDLIGLSKVKELLQENVINALGYPEVWVAYKKKKSLGILFYGPPGTGKTLVARSLAGQASIYLRKLKEGLAASPNEKDRLKAQSLPDSIPIVIAKINEIVDPYTGNTERNVHKVFETARAHAPSILFVDELDGLGGKRAGLSGQGTAEVMKLAVNQFLQEMDGIDTNKENLFVIGATNQPWEVDSALKRAGRFESSIFFSPPTYPERVALFKHYLKGKPLARMNYGRLARATPGYSQADIAGIVGKAITKATAITIGSKDPTILHLICMKDILEILKDKDIGKGTLGDWFSSVTKEFDLIPRKKGQKDESRLTQDDRKLYKDLFDCIRKRRKDRGMDDFIRFWSLYVF